MQYTTSKNLIDLIFNSLERWVKDLNEDLAFSRSLDFSTSNYLKLSSFIIQFLYSEFFYTFPNK